MRRVDGTVGTTKKGTPERFLEELAKCGNVSDSIRRSGFPRTSAYRLREQDPEFYGAWEDALDIAVDSLEKEGWRRARDGTLKPVFQNGQKVGQIREYSDTLLIFLLKGHRPERFKERRETQVTGKNGGPISLTYSELKQLPPDELIRLHRETIGAFEED